MAKESMVVKNQRTKILIAKHKEKRAKWKAALVSPDSSLEEKFKVMMLLDKTRDASATRYRNRCAITGRPRGYYRKFDLSRNCIREFAAFGLLPGVKKDSW